MKALVLAGGFPQIALIKELKSRGMEVALADYYEKPVARAFADKFFQISTLDVDAIRKLCMEEKVDFLITVCTDQALHTVAKISEELDLPCYIDYETALNVTNKRYMKEIFTQRNIPTAKHKILTELTEDVVKDMHFPLIVKPVDCNSSKGVRRCNDWDDLSKFFTDAITFSRTNTAVVEEFIEGVELSVDVYVENGKARVLCISQSDKIADQDKFIIFRAIWPANVSEDVVAQINDVAQEIADAFGIYNSPMLIQFLSDGKKVYVVECSARTGGGVKYLLIKRTSGFDVIKAVVDLTLGTIPHVGEIKAEQKYLINDFIYCKPGIYDHLEGFEELLAEGIIKDYYLFKWQGAEFHSIRASGDRLAGYTIVADHPDELIRKHNETRRRIKAISTTGEDMIRHELLTDLLMEDGKLVKES